MCYMILSIFFPILAGIFLLVRKEMKVRKHLLFLTGSFLVLEGILVILAISLAKGELLLLFNLTDRLPILLKLTDLQHSLSLFYQYQLLHLQFYILLNI